MRRPLPRRPARREDRRPPRPGGLPTPRRMLRDANDLLAEGQFGEASLIFARLSDGAARHNMPIRAGELALRASDAFVRSGEVGTGIDWAKKGLRHLAHTGRPHRLTQGLAHIIALLRETGHVLDADQLEQDTRNALEKSGMSLEQGAVGTMPPRQPDEGTLPAKCSGCGAPLLPDEVEWHDTRTAECIYCGTIAKTG